MAINPHYRTEVAYDDAHLRSVCGLPRAGIVRQNDSVVPVGWDAGGVPQRSQTHRQPVVVGGEW